MKTQEQNLIEQQAETIESLTKTVERLEMQLAALLDSILHTQKHILDHINRLRK